MKKPKIAILSQNSYNGVMKISRPKLFFGFFLMFFLFNACSGNQNSGVNSSAPNANRIANSTAEIIVQDDIEELGKIIKLPYIPEEATYNEVNSDGKRKLVAVMQFSSANANQIVSQAGKHSPPAPFDVEAENWFPPELIAKSQETGDASLKGGSFSANDFLQSPYIKGRLTRINDTNYFVLEISSF